MALLSVAKNAPKQDKLHAIQQMGIIYETFQEDFGVADVLKTLVLPQVQFMADDSWEVRATVCENMEKFKVYDLEVLNSLICRQKDDNEEVRYASFLFYLAKLMIRRASLRTLKSFGVNTKSALRAIMIELRMITPKKEELPKRSDWLDVLLVRLKQQKEALANTQSPEVWRWLQLVDPRCEQLVERPPSPTVSLCFPDVNDTPASSRVSNNAQEAA